MRKRRTQRRCRCCRIVPSTTFILSTTSQQQVSRLRFLGFLFKKHQQIKSRRMTACNCNSVYLPCLRALHALHLRPALSIFNCGYLTCTRRLHFAGLRSVAAQSPRRNRYRRYNHHQTFCLRSSRIFPTSIVVFLHRSKPQMPSLLVIEFLKSAERGFSR